MRQRTTFWESIVRRMASTREKISRDAGVLGELGASAIYISSRCSYFRDTSTKPSGIVLCFDNN